jgi:uncharacterized sodium:solute symporter family permease YidK
LFYGFLESMPRFAADRINKMNVHLVDWAVLALYFSTMAGMGFYFSKRSRQSSDAYFLGGRSFPGWAIGISLIGSMISCKRQLSDLLPGRA